MQDMCKMCSSLIRLPFLQGLVQSQMGHLGFGGECKPVLSSGSLHCSALAEGRGDWP